VTGFLERHLEKKDGFSIKNASIKKKVLKKAYVFYEFLLIVSAILEATCIFDFNCCSLQH